MKCGENHSTHLCNKSTTTPAKCANCDGEHISISKKCPKRPQPKNNKPAWTEITKPETTTIKEIQKEEITIKRQQTNRTKTDQINNDRIHTDQAKRPTKK